MEKTKTVKYKKQSWDLDTFSELTAWEVRNLAQEMQDNMKDVSLDIDIHLKSKNTKIKKKVRWI
jgi:hypothetical protein